MSPASQPNTTTHQMIYRQMSASEVHSSFQRGVVLDIRSSGDRSFARVTATIEHPSRRFYSITTEEDGIVETSREIWRKQVYRARVWKPKDSSMIRTQRPLPPVGQRRARDIHLEVGDVITIRPASSRPFKVRIVAPPSITNPEDWDLVGILIKPDNNLIQPWGQVLNMKGDAIFSRRRLPNGRLEGHAPRCRVIWLDEIESIVPCDPS